MTAAITACTVIALCLLIFFLVSPAWERPQRNLFSGIMFAHRGLFDASAGVPENSLSAFRAARDGGFGIELDVRLTRDGFPVVFHDESLERMCGANVKVSEYDLDRLRALRLSNTDEKIPTLEEALKESGSAPLICEIKPNKPDDVKEICEKVYSVLRKSSCIWSVESFSPLVLKWFIRNAPDVVRGQLICRPHGRSVAEFFAANALFNFISRPDFIAYEYGMKTPGLLAALASNPLTVTWTVRTDAQAEKASRRADSIIFEKFAENKP